VWPLLCLTNRRARGSDPLPRQALVPFAFGHELMRQEKRNLTSIGPISDIPFDHLIGAGCAERVIAAWVGNVSAGLTHCYRRAAEEGVPRSIEVREHSNLSLGLALMVAGVGSPFIPTKTTHGSDISRTNPYLVVGDNPLEPGEPVVFVRALVPDVVVFHVQKADREGHAHVWGNLGIARERALAARAVILTAEELARVEELTADPNRILIPAHKVVAVVEYPGGADPSPVPGYRDRDHEAFHAYHEAARTQGGEGILGAGDHGGSGRTRDQGRRRSFCGHAASDARLRRREAFACTTRGCLL